MTRPSPDFAPVVAACAAKGQPGVLFQALDAAMRQAIGHKLFTILVIHPGARQSQRYYSNMPVEYPVGGRKPITGSPWFQRVIDDGVPYIGRDYADITEVFYDHELIRSLGCESVLNLPVRWNGGTIATINLLHEAGWYEEADIATGQLFAALAIPGVLKVIAEG